MTISRLFPGLRALTGLAAAIFLTLGLAACENTLEGAGDDIEEMGHEVEEATD